MRARRPKDAKRRVPHRTGGRERRGLWLLFLYVSLSLGLSYVNWASQECCLFYLGFSLLSLDLPLFYFRRLFPSRSFSHCHSGLFFPYSNYLTESYLMEHFVSVWLLSLSIMLLRFIYIVAYVRASFHFMDE